MKIERKNPKLEAVMKELKKIEVDRFKQAVTAQATHCTGMSGDITLCAVLCTNLNCPDFSHNKCGGQILGACPLLIKCKGFIGDGGGCGPFEVVGIR